MDPATKVHLNPTEKQILLYGVLRGLNMLFQQRLGHGDLRLSDVLLDEQKYPALARASMDIPWTRTEPLIDKSIEEIGHLGPLNFTKRGARFSALNVQSCDEWSFAMIVYQLVEERPIWIAMNPGETFVDVPLSLKKANGFDGCLIVFGQIRIFPLE
jgi:hypothetical protein